MDREINNQKIALGAVKTLGDLARDYLGSVDAIRKRSTSDVESWRSGIKDNKNYVRNARRRIREAKPELDTFGNLTQYTIVVEGPDGVSDLSELVDDAKTLKTKLKNTSQLSANSKKLVTQYVNAASAFAEKYATISSHVKSLTKRIDSAEKAIQTNNETKEKREGYLVSQPENVASNIADARNLFKENVYEQVISQIGLRCMKNEIHLLKDIFEPFNNSLLIVASEFENLARGDRTDLYQAVRDVAKENNLIRTRETKSVEEVVTPEDVFDEDSESIPNSVEIITQN